MNENYNRQATIATGTMAAHMTFTSILLGVALFVHAGSPTTQPTTAPPRNVATVVREITLAADKALADDAALPANKHSADTQQQLGDAIGDAAGIGAGEVVPCELVIDEVLTFKGRHYVTGFTPLPLPPSLVGKFSGKIPQCHVVLLAKPGTQSWKRGDALSLPQVTIDRTLLMQVSLAGDDGSKVPCIGFAEMYAAIGSGHEFVPAPPKSVDSKHGMFDYGR